MGETHKKRGGGKEIIGETESRDRVNKAGRGADRLRGEIREIRQIGDSGNGH